MGQAAPALLSVGYEGSSIDAFVEKLQAAQVTVLVDVRFTPLSRKAGFSKTRLREALEAAGITYRHARALGNPKSNREPFWSGDVAQGRETFRAMLATDDAGLELGQLAELLQAERVAVMCFEADHDRCHRHVVVAETLNRIQVPVAHLS